MLVLLSEDIWMTLILLLFKSLAFWKNKTVVMRTDNGMVFIGVGQKDKVEKFEEILEARYLDHINKYIKKHG